jgi:formate/nitrite transporter FocA (FNT family)
VDDCSCRQLDRNGSGRSLLYLPPVLAPELRGVMVDISRHILETSWIESLFHAISAGFLIAAMVWLIPSAEA